MNVSGVADNNVRLVPNRNFLFNNVGTNNSEQKKINNQHAYSVSISREGLEKLNQNKQVSVMGAERADKYRSILSKSQIDVTGTIEAEFHRRYTMLNSELKKDKNDNLNPEELGKNALFAYSQMYDEIKKGYAQGTREIYIADSKSEFGYRRATEEEELEALDATFDFHASYTEAYVKFLDEDKDGMLKGIQNTRNLWEAAKEKRNHKKDDSDSNLNKVSNQGIKNEETSINLAEQMKKSRNLVKMQYNQFSMSITNLVKSVYAEVFVGKNS